MAFDLRIAVKPDPVEANLSTTTPPSRPQDTLVSLIVKGELNEAGYTELVRRVRQSFEDGANTVIVDMQNIVLQDVACLERFAASLMAERAGGRQVQVVAREPSFYATCASIAGSRDWLIEDAETEVRSCRRALHVDSGGH